MPMGNPPFTVLAAEYGGDPQRVGLGRCAEYAAWLEETLAATLLTAG
jgi:hypothetical protein